MHTWIRVFIHLSYLKHVIIFLLFSSSLSLHSTLQSFHIFSFLHFLHHSFPSLFAHHEKAINKRIEENLFFFHLLLIKIYNVIVLSPSLLGNTFSKK